VGNKLGVGEDEVKQRFVDRWLTLFGDDRFAWEGHGWLLLGIDSQIVGSGLPRELEQLAWLQRQVDRAEESGLAVALFTHAPPYIKDPHENTTGRKNYWAMDPEPRRQILRIIQRPAVRLLAHGHLHWYHVTSNGHAGRLWCPSLNFIVDDPSFPRGGATCGFLLHRFHQADHGPGEHRHEHELIRMDYQVQTIWFFRPWLELPNREPRVLAELLINGSALQDARGELLPGLAQRLREMGRKIRLTVTCPGPAGGLAPQLEGLPLEVKPLRTGEDKLEYAKTLGPEKLVVIGHGRSDAAVCKAAAVGIAVQGDGLSTELLMASDIVVEDLESAFTLLDHPDRLKAKLRE
jgi:soluble P-type ATPase